MEIGGEISTVSEGLTGGETTPVALCQRRDRQGLSQAGGSHLAVIVDSATHLIS